MLLLLKLFDLLLQLFGFAAEKLLLIALFEGLLLRVALLLGELLLAASELFEFLKRFIDVFLALLLRAGTGLALLVLILFGVELQIEQALQIATGPTTAASASAALAESHLDLPERGFRA